MDKKRISSDVELKNLLRKFLQAFYEASTKNENEYKRIFSTENFALFPGGIVELNKNVNDSLGEFIQRSMKILGSKHGNEKTLQKITMEAARNFLVENDIEKAIDDLYYTILNEPTTYDYLIPNRLFHFETNIDEISIGRVRAIRLKKFQKERNSKFPKENFRTEYSSKFSIDISNGILIRTLRNCWLVSVDATQENVEEEANWLIDIAVSLIRLSYNGWQGHYPSTGWREPLPSKTPHYEQDGVKFSGSKVIWGGITMPPGYEIDSSVIKFTKTARFKRSAEILMDPPKGSVAERLSKGLGWLTRGRQAKDRSERLLYFFTAIEALLSSGDKNTPVVQTISRFAAAIITNNNDMRKNISKEIQKLYGYRSSLIHNGDRSISLSAANSVQIIAESIFVRCLKKLDLTQKHDDFCADMTTISYGLKWPKSKNSN